MKKRRKRLVRDAIVVSLIAVGILYANSVNPDFAGFMIFLLLIYVAAMVVERFLKKEDDIV